MTILQPAKIFAAPADATGQRENRLYDTEWKPGDTNGGRLFLPPPGHGRIWTLPQASRAEGLESRVYAVGGRRSPDRLKAGLQTGRCRDALQAHSFRENPAVPFQASLLRNEFRAPSFGIRH
jgi:hypothetical protein